ncbi:hypothetical protein B9G69_005825 [Bdellovibrio sp. SKB1291214]|uniref:hypothetical protein n=1 Tax=Bdellovibrio sp. SKB1291214 TaxID=1732569 RepID=UPI0020CD6086|nr:hypothetical protein [Bdellovibrio sp. SKB1291214]UYL10095.1 hypothetical protein B9G69_005825 [Bdellovibrio sp. SKB1291214]
MILMWLGSFVLMMFGLTMSQKYAALLFQGFQKYFLDKNLDQPKMIKMFQYCLDVVLLEVSPQKSLYAGMGLYNLRVLSLRPAVLVMCLSTIGAWWVALLGMLFLSFNGSFLLGLCVLGLISSVLTPKTRTVLQWIMGTGIFLIGGELVLKNSNVLIMALGQSEFAFFLADGRIVSIVSILLAAALISLVVRVEFWSLALGLSLLFVNAISINGAIALVAGERIGRMLLFWWHTRSLNQDCRRVGMQFSLASILGTILGLLLAGEVRVTMNMGYTSEMTAYQDKSVQFVLLFLIILGVEFVAQMVWGHFGGATKVDEIQDAKYISAVWFSEEYASAGVYQWAKAKIHKRLSEVRYHMQGLNSLQQGQVPEHIQLRLKAEEAELTKIESLI